jgi:hypothetical protein
MGRPLRAPPPDAAASRGGGVITRMRVFAELTAARGPDLVPTPAYGMTRRNS